MSSAQPRAVGVHFQVLRLLYQCLVLVLFGSVLKEAFRVQDDLLHWDELRVGSMEGIPRMICC